MARAAAACCSATVLLLAMAIFTSGASPEPLTTVQPTDRAGDGQKSDLLPTVNQDSGKDEDKIKVGKRRGDDAGEAASLASTEEEGKKVGSGWAKAKKLDGEKGDSDSDSDSDHDDDSDSSSDSDSDSDSDSESDSDSDVDVDSDGNGSRNGKNEAPGGKHDELLMKQ